MTPLTSKSPNAVTFPYNVDVVPTIRFRATAAPPSTCKVDVFPVELVTVAVP